MSGLQAPAPGVYRRHRPKTTALYEVVRDNLETLYGAIGDGALAVRIAKHARKELEALDGFTLHADTRAGAQDAAGREALLRYVLRPPLAQERLEPRPHGLVRIVLKKPPSGGGTMKVKVLGLAVLGYSLASLAAAQGLPAPPASDDLKATVAAYRARLATNPGDAVTHNKLGICYQRQHQLKLARKEYETAVQLNAAYAEPWNNLGTLEQGRGKYKKAVAHYRKAIALKPDRASFQRNLGTAWLAWGRFPLAVEAFTEAVRLDANLASLDSAAFTESGVAKGQLYFAYAKVLAARGDFESALVWLTKAHEAGFHDFGHVSADSDFAQVRSDPRYAALLVSPSTRGPGGSSGPPPRALGP